MSTHHHAAAHPASNNGISTSRVGVFANCAAGTSVFTGRPNAQLGDSAGSTRNPHAVYGGDNAPSGAEMIADRPTRPSSLSANATAHRPASSTENVEQDAEDDWERVEGDDVRVAS